MQHVRWGVPRNGPVPGQDPYVKREGPQSHFAAPLKHPMALYLFSLFISIARM
jgi:hypothetical protein